MNRSGGPQHFAKVLLKRALSKTASSRLVRPMWRRFKRMMDGDRLAQVEYWLSFMLDYTTADEWKMLTQAWDDTTPLPADAAELSADNPVLTMLRSRYAALNLPVCVPSQWNAKRLHATLNLSYFRGENAYVWQWRELPRATIMKFYILAQYLRTRDSAGLMARLGEDGAFGCWNYRYPGVGAVSRDLVDSTNEILFLDRHLGIFERPQLRVLDIGAGYGRLAWRMSQAVPGLADYCCVDAIAESTFLCNYYLRYRGVMPPTRVVPLHEVESALAASHFDLVVNVHSFSECTHAAIAWWMERVAALKVAHLFIVPNEPDAFLSTETDGSKRDFLPLIHAAGYELVKREPVFDDPAVRGLMRIEDHYYLFHRRPE